MSPYEQRALADIVAWKARAPRGLRRLAAGLSRRFQRAGELIFAAPLLGGALEKMVEGVIHVAGELSRRSLRRQALRKAYGLDSAEELRRLDLSRVDEALARLRGKYVGLALAEGAVTGAAGVPGIPLDLVAIVTLELRAVGEHATLAGFDLSRPAERLFALSVLGVAASAEGPARAAALARLVAEERTWKELERGAFVQLVKQVCRVLGVRLSQRKLAQIVPGVGALVGGTLNAAFTARVCDAAFHLYRERFLVAKYGPEILQASGSASSLHADT